MGKSYKKVPISGFTTARSEKEDKRILNRILRHKVKASLKSKDIEELEMFLEPKKDEVMDKWSMSKDGKKYYDNRYKDKYWYKKMMRK